VCVCACVFVPVDVGIGFAGLPLAVCHQRQEAIPDGGGSLTGELLVDDGLGQALKVAEGRIVLTVVRVEPRRAVSIHQGF
jgi:hypothetical protein